MNIMNQNQGESTMHPILGSFTPIEDLLYHDCPYVFTFWDAEGVLSLAYLVGMDGESTRYLGVRIDEGQLTELKGGALSLRRVFRTWAWDITLDANANIQSVSKRAIEEVNPKDLPPDDLVL